MLVPAELAWFDPQATRRVAAHAAAKILFTVLILIVDLP
jgi:hypothetical protein